MPAFVTGAIKNPFITPSINTDAVTKPGGTSASENDINRAFNSAEAAMNRSWQSAEAEIQREWYEYMSNTAYERSMEDLKRAGINPILAYQNGGASSATTGVPSGSAGSYQTSTSNNLSSMINSTGTLIYGLAQLLKLFVK